MTQPSDRARKAAHQYAHCFRDPSLEARLAQDFATFERETPGFAAGVEAAAKAIETQFGHLAWSQDQATAIRALTPAPPADLCADIAQKSADAIAALLAQFAKAADDAERMAGHDGPMDPIVPLDACRSARAALANAVAKRPD